MPTGRADPAERSGGLRFVSALLPLVLVGAGLTACSDDDSPVDPGDPEQYVVQAIERTLHRRTRAIVDRDGVRFDRILSRRDPGFVEDQDRYLANLEQLPLGTVRIDLDDTSLEKAGMGYWAEVTVRLQLQGYDVAPAITRDRWRFVPTRNQRRYLLASTTDPRWEERNRLQPQPWDLAEDLDVREAPGVLGIFDDDTVGSASTVLAAVSEGRFQVRSILPTDLADPGGVVLYALSDPDFVDSLSGLPFNDPERLDGATIPVPHDPADPDGRIVSYRVLLSPHVLDQDPEGLDRLVRHELTHVAIGGEASGVPLWLSEGLAEYVSVQPIAPAERRLQADALDLAAAGVTDLPTDDDFSGDHAEGWYAVSWWICQYIADTYGQAELWSLLEALHAGGDQAQVVSDQLGISTAQLASEGVALMRRTYG